MNKKKQAAIVIDSWKKKIFVKNLTAAGYEVEEKLGLSPTTITLVVLYDPEQTRALIELNQATNQECARSKLN